jgi:hypothetical protein
VNDKDMKNKMENRRGSKVRGSNDLLCDAYGMFNQLMIEVVVVKA